MKCLEFKKRKKMKQEANHRDSDSGGFNSYVEGRNGNG